MGNITDITLKAFFEDGKVIITSFMELGLAGRKWKRVA